MNDVPMKEVRSMCLLNWEYMIEFDLFKLFKKQQLHACTNSNISWRLNENQIEESICTVVANSIKKKREPN